MNEQEFLESMQEEKGKALDRIHGLLSGTSEYANMHQILDDLMRKARFRTLDPEGTGWEYDEGPGGWIARNEDEYDDDRGIDPKDNLTLGPCGCTDYHMADCPLMTGG